MNSQELFFRSKQVSPGGVHSPVRGFRGVGGVPVFMESGQGAYLRDVEGRSYIDFCLSWGPLLFGHQDPEVKEAVLSALDRGWSYGTAEPYSLELAELITRNVPWVESVRFVNSGTEAVMSALRVARAATGRDKIVKFEGCYHGHVDSMLVKAGSGLAEMASPDSAGVSKETAAQTISLPLNNIDALEQVFQKQGAEIAAVIVEPIPANNGLLLQHQDFLNKIRVLTSKHGALLIFDEVITGFRVAFGGVAEKTGIKPDLVTYGKIIGGGFPVGAYGGRRDLMDWVAPSGPVYQAGTLSGNPVAMVAGTAMLKKILRENPYKKLESKVEDLSVQIEKIAQRKSKMLKVQRAASMFWMISGEIETQDGWVRSVEAIPATQKADYSVFFHNMLEMGVYLAPSGFEVSFLSTAHSDKDLQKFLECVEKSL